MIDHGDVARIDVGLMAIFIEFMGKGVGRTLFRLACLATLTQSNSSMSCFPANINLSAISYYIFPGSTRQR